MKQLLIFIILAIASFSAGAQKVERYLTLPYSNRIPATVPSVAASQLWYYTGNSDLYGYDKSTQEWGIYSKQSAFGEIRISNDTATLSFTNTTPAAIDELSTGLMRDFTFTNDSTITYSGPKVGYFRVAYSTSFSFAEAGIMTGYAKVNSTIIYQTRFRQTVTTATSERLTAAGSGIVQLYPGDIIRFVFAPGSHTGTDVLTVYEMNLNIEQIN